MTGFLLGSLDSNLNGDGCGYRGDDDQLKFLLPYSYH